MSEKHPECPLYNPLNCKEYYNPKLCAFVRKDKICLKKKKPKAKEKEKTEKQSVIFRVPDPAAAYAVPPVSEIKAGSIPRFCMAAAQRSSTGSSNTIWSENGQVSQALSRISDSS